jgi:hypothetical protein
MGIGTPFADGTREIARCSTFFHVLRSYYSICRNGKNLSPVLSIIVDLAPHVQLSQRTMEFMKEVKHMRNTKLSLLALPLCMVVFTGVGAGAAPLTWSLATPVPAQQQQKPNQTQPLPSQPQTPPDQTQPASPASGQDQTKQDQAQSTTFTGTITKDGEQYILKDSSGGVFKLDDATRAQPFEGKSVKVTGKLDTDAKLIHVENIEAVAA